ncbi:uncharacterized protein LOC111788214 isoform X1 [Cucurbita pepo subsp. pepo]|uniref:uncharacterized protein LOC111788214 isoform X1 n=1 Tax=Cucurbita pepo subsp. pepo TaxID=3664 RepID=UPI000C9D60A9|nr:uncharacterized protein LOC111788214 isoform X1 [Cucurbita pepo subsp. pepo]
MFFHSLLAFQPFFFIASMTPRSPLRQLLQEQQEPFELEEYLFERDYSRKSFSRGSGSGFACSSGKFDNIMKFGKGFVEINKVLRNTCKKLVSINRKQQTKDLGKSGWILSVGCKRVAESENFLSPCSSRKKSSSFSRKDNKKTSSSKRRHHATSSTSNTFEAPEPCNLQILKGAAGKKVVSRSMKSRHENREAGSDSIIPARLNNNQLRNGIPLQKKVPDDSILSATLSELLLYSAAMEKPSGIETAELQELVTSNTTSQLLIFKRVIHQTKQLLFYCVGEVVEAHSKHGRHIDSEEARRLIHEKETTGKKANLSNSLNSDYLLSAAEWWDLKPQKQLIGAEIGALILEEIINEVVTELIDNQ